VTEIMELMTLEATTSTASAPTGHTTVLDIVSPVIIIILSFLWITKDLVGVWNYLENLFGLFFIIWVLIWMVFQW
jgi:hypothetical protein